MFNMRNFASRVSHDNLAAISVRERRGTRSAPPAAATADALGPMRKILRIVLVGGKCRPARRRTTGGWRRDGRWHRVREAPGARHAAGGAAPRPRRARGATLRRRRRMSRARYGACRNDGGKCARLPRSASPPSHNHARQVALCEKIGIDPFYLRSRAADRGGCLGPLVHHSRFRSGAGTDAWPDSGRRRIAGRGCSSRRP